MNDVDTLATALYATTDDIPKEHPDLAPWRPPVGITPRLSDVEPVALATMQAILGCTSEATWLRHARAHLRHLFLYPPRQPGYNKRLRKAAGPMRSVNQIPATTAPRQTLIGDKNYFGRGFEREPSEHGVQLLRPARKGERERPGATLFKPLRQVIESINETFKGGLDLERHRGRTPGGVIARVMQRILALTAAIWHNDATGQTILRSLTPWNRSSRGMGDSRS